MNRRALGRWWRTVRPLRREQVVGRLAHELRQRAFRGVPKLLPLVLGHPAPPEVAVRLTDPVDDPEVQARAQTAQRHGTGRLAGHEVSLRDWARADLPKLVRYHLHYLDAARDLAEAGRVTKNDALTGAAHALVHDWMEAHPPGGEAWEPYPTSVRLQNLCILAGLAARDCPVWLRRLAALHARYALSFPEVHLQGNHLWKGWTAVAMAGLTFSGAEAKRWEEVGLAQARHEWTEQLLPDGGHYERSVMYHLIAWSDLLDVRDLARARGRDVPGLSSALSAMAAFAGAVMHPDGEPPLFNDAVLGQAPHPAKLFARQGETWPVPRRLADLPDYGLSVLRGGEDVLLFDAGPLGPAHQSGHAHSDTLSYELSVAGERRAVNAGVDGYQSANRAFFRSAVAHNTVTVDGEGPDELWAQFRVGGRSRVTSRGAEDLGEALVARGSLAAFQGWTHSRKVALVPGKAVVVWDEVAADHEATVVSRARLVPGKVGVRFAALLGQEEGRRTAYAPELGKVFDVAEHSVQGRGRRVSLCYALVWGAKEVRLEAGVAVMDGRPIGVSM